VSETDDLEELKQLKKELKQEGFQYFTFSPKFSPGPFLNTLLINNWVSDLINPPDKIKYS